MEVWKDIPGYENLYQVSDLGRVKSLERVVNNGSGNRIVKERILSLGKMKIGYVNVVLYKEKRTHRYIHQLVAEAFLNHKPNGWGLVVNHINLDKTDNRLINLEIITQRENVYFKGTERSSKYKGVSWNKEAKKWQSFIYLNGGNKNLGLFTNESEASNAYQTALIKINS